MGDIKLNSTSGSITLTPEDGAGATTVTVPKTAGEVVVKDSSGNASFGDNEKARFGASNDLQIYHDGFNSYIKDSGTGNLKMLGTQLKLADADDTAYLDGATGGATRVYYNGSVKLATTSTGIDVTGTVTADGLTVADGTSGQINVHSSSYNIQGGPNYGDMRFNAPRFRFYEDGTTIRMNIDNGDISFYEDTGTTPKFFWDASAESLGIGTSSPSAKLDIVPSSTGRIIETTSYSTAHQYHHVFQNSSGSLVGTITVTPTSTSYTTSSDYRLKENVVPMSASIDRLKELKPSRFNFIADADKTVDGFLAHEAQEVVPEAVSGEKDAMRTEEYEVEPAVEATYDDDGNELTPAVEAVMGTREVPDYQGIDQSKLVPLLVASLQEAVEKIESQETIINDLVARVTQLENV